MKMLLHGLLFSPLLGASEAGRKCLAASHLLQHKVSSCGFRTLQQFKLIQEILSFAQKQPIAFCGFCFFFFFLPFSVSAKQGREENCSQDRWSKSANSYKAIAIFFKIQPYSTSLCKTLSPYGWIELHVEAEN